MNIEFAAKFSNDHKDRIYNLFVLYQLTETLFFMKLYKEDLSDDIEKMNQEFSRKTLGSIKAKYTEKYPNDEHKLLILLETCRIQRNSFMHSFYILLASFGEQEDGLKTCNVFFDSFEKNADELYEKIVVIDL